MLLVLLDQAANRNRSREKNIDQKRRSKAQHFPEKKNIQRCIFFFFFFFFLGGIRNLGTGGGEKKKSLQGLLQNRVGFFCNITKERKGNGRTFGFRSTAPFDAIHILRHQRFFGVTYKSKRVTESILLSPPRKQGSRKGRYKSFPFSEWVEPKHL